MHHQVPAPAPGRGPASTRHTTQVGGLTSAGTIQPPAGAAPASSPAAGKHRTTSHQPAPGKAPRRQPAAGGGPGPQLEKIDLTGKAGGARFRIAAQTGPGSQLGAAIAVLVLATATCLLMTAAHLDGVLGLITSVAATSVLCAVARFISRPWASPRPGEEETTS